MDCPVFTYSENRAEASLTARNIRLFPSHVEFEALTLGEISRVHLPIPGGFSIYNALAALAAAKDRAVYGYTPEEATILKKLYADLASIQDEVGDDTPLVITMSTQVAALFDMNTTLARSVSPTDFRQGDITLKVKSLNGQHPIIRVGSGRLKTSYQFNDGTTENQVKGGFTPADDAQDINWIICPRSAPIAVSRTDKVRIFDPETYQKKRAWAVDYRKYHDLWVLDNKMNTILVNIKQPKAGA